jgi:hypothetical protein
VREALEVSAAAGMVVLIKLAPTLLLVLQILAAGAAAQEVWLLEQARGVAA